VFQDFYLFASSIGENIAVSREYDKKRVEDCLDKSGILSFVSKLEQRDETVIENGTENAIDISGGQEQKISIARALYKDAPFVILDEPTAALDPISEAEIYERFHEMVEDKTSVYISHRMSSCRFCDEILVFDEGTITERGSHEELLQRNGTYSSLWNAQAQYYA
jgi:ATP-binding cassette subfamily B protein